MNELDLTNKGFIRQPDGSYAKTPLVASPLPDAKPQPIARPKPLDVDPAKRRSQERTLVRITRYACRLVDFDNGAGGCKYLVDAMRYEALIKDDSPEHIKFEFEQVKVKTKAEEGTEIITEEPTPYADLL